MGQIRVDDGNTDVTLFPSFSGWTMQVGVSFQKLEGARFPLGVTNSSKKTVADIEIDFTGQEGSMRCLLRGTTRKRIRALRPMEALAFHFLFACVNRRL
jgi:hypothetical protein